jgi:hypothetical protein
MRERPGISSSRAADLSNESLAAGIGKCLLTALLVAWPLAGVSFLLFTFLFNMLFSADRFPFFVGLVTTGALLALIVLRDKRFGPPERVRTSIVWGVRYLFVGAALGLLCSTFVGGAVSTPYAAAFWGAVLGGACGSLGGAFHGWLKERARSAGNSSMAT